MLRFLLPLALALSACTLSQPEGAAMPATLTPDKIEVTPLPAPSKAAEKTEAAKPPAPTPEPAPAPSPEPAPAPLSPEQATCLAKGGTWAKVGMAGLHSCVTPTRDAGKSCRKADDCEGLCLARSRTCAPIEPLFGCNPILQADGTEATLCID